MDADQATAQLSDERQGYNWKKVELQGSKEPISETSASTWNSGTWKVTGVTNYACQKGALRARCYELGRTRVRRVNVTADMLALYLEDARIVGMPTVWSPQLSRRARPSAKTAKSSATAPDCTGPTLDEYVSVRSILLG